MKLYPALGISSGDVVAFVGAGGKSSAILVVAAELIEDGMTVIAVPTTKVFVSEAEKIGPVVASEDPGERTSRVKEKMSDSRAIVAGSALISKNRVGGVEPEEVTQLAKLADVVLVEADGSRRRPLKGTADHEPVLPDSVTLVVAVANISAFGKPVTEEYVHRPEIFASLTGVGPGQSITARAFGLSLSRGSLGKVPNGVSSTVLLTGVTPGRSMSDASVVTRELWRQGIKNVVLSSLPGESPPKVWIP